MESAVLVCLSVVPQFIQRIYDTLHFTHDETICGYCLFFNKKRDPGKAWHTSTCDFKSLGGKQQERQSTGNLWILSSWDHLGKAR